MKTTIRDEMVYARKKYGPFNSTHEVYGVLQEEVNEFWNLVTGLDPAYEKQRQMLRELRQVAAIAQRAIQELEKNEIKWV